MTEDRLERVARWTPLFILAYFALQFAIRVGFSSNLETDEAQLVGQTHFALGYGNSHPPLYNWLVAAVLWITGSWPLAVATVKALLLSGSYLLAYDAIRRVTARYLPGLLLVTSFLLLPQIVWKSQITLTHSVLVMFATVAAFHAVVLITTRGYVLDFLWFALAAAIGGLAKYNFFLVLAAVLIAAYCVPYLRIRLYTHKLTYSVLLFIILISPHLVWAFSHFKESTARLAKLDRENSVFGFIDVPGVGIDGLLATMVAILAWFAPLGFAWFLIIYSSKKKDFSSDDVERVRSHHFALFFGYVAVISLAIFVGIVVLGDFHSVHERYMTPILIGLPFWLVLAWPLESYTKAPTHLLRVGIVLVVIMNTAWPMWLLFGREQYAYPYEAFANSLKGANQGAVAVASRPEKYASNIAVRLENAKMWNRGKGIREVILLWDGSSGRPPSDIVDELKIVGYKANGPTISRHFPYTNHSGEVGKLNIQFYELQP